MFRIIICMLAVFVFATGVFADDDEGVYDFPIRENETSTTPTNNKTSVTSDRTELARRFMAEIEESGAIDHVDDRGWVRYVRWNQAVWPLTYKHKKIIGNCFSDIYNGKQVEIRDAHSGKRILTVIESGRIHIY